MCVFIQLSMPRRSFPKVLVKMPVVMQVGTSTAQTGWISEGSIHDAVSRGCSTKIPRAGGRTVLADIRHLCGWSPLPHRLQLRGLGPCVRAHLSTHTPTRLLIGDAAIRTPRMLLDHGCFQILRGLRPTGSRKGASTVVSPS